MASSCLTWNNGKPCVWFDLKLNCCSDPVDYVSSEGGLQVCRYHQYAVEGKTSEQGESPATDRQQLKAEIRSILKRFDDEFSESGRHCYGDLLTDLRELSAV